MFRNSAQLEKRRRPLAGKSPHNRRGIAIVLVLGMLSITMAMSYAMLRTRAQAEMLQENFSRQGEARLAAEAGMSRALKIISQSSWTGVDAVLTGSLDAQTTYRVTFATGDPTLTSGSANYDEYPFRLTITSVGTAVAIDNANINTTHTLKTVVQLVRKKLVDQSSAFTSLQGYTVAQWNAVRGATIEPPMQVSGAAYLRGIPSIFTDTLSESNSLSQYTNDLRRMKTADVADHRPFSTSVTLPFFSGSSIRTVLSNMSTTTSYHFSFATTAPVGHPGTVTSYTLYPGGNSYSIPNLSSLYGSEIKNAAVGPDPVANPLGIFRTTAALRFGDNSSLQGTLIAPSTSQPITVRGNNVVLSGKTLPALSGDSTSTPRQLPVAMANYEMTVQTGATCTVNGLIMAWEGFQVDPHSANTRLTVNGRVFANDFDIHGISTWAFSTSWWQSRYNEFNWQIAQTGPLNSPYFPVWLHLNRGMDPQPTLTFSPDSSGVTYHWHSWNQPIYQPGEGDDGLRWNFVSMWVEE